MASTGTNIIGTKTYRDKYRLATLDQILRNALVAEAICEVDRSDLYTLQNPYGSQPTTVISGLTGTYVVADFTTTNDTLTISDEFKVSEQVYGFIDTMAITDMFASRADEQAYSVAAAIDNYVINVLCTAATTTTYTTPAGAFSAANWPVILGNVASKFMGYADVYRGLFIVLENTDLPGVIVSQMSSGFSFSDLALRNGFLMSQNGFDIYVVRSGLYATTTLGTQSVTNSGHRLAGVKRISTYAAPRGVQVEEKAVSGKTGMEIVTWGLIGAKLWATKAALLCNITVTS